MAYLRQQVVVPDGLSYLPFPSEATPYLIDAHIGTHVTQRHISDLHIRLNLTPYLPNYAENT